MLGNLPPPPRILDANEGGGPRDEGDGGVGGTFASPMGLGCAPITEKMKPEHLHERRIMLFLSHTKDVH